MELESSQSYDKGEDVVASEAVSERLVRDNADAGFGFLTAADKKIIEAERLRRKALDDSASSID